MEFVCFLFFFGNSRLWAEIWSQDSSKYGINGTQESLQYWQAAEIYWEIQYRIDEYVVQQHAIAVIAGYHVNVCIMEGGIETSPAVKFD
jgi:hypothetical protein